MFLALGNYLNGEAHQFHSFYGFQVYFLQDFRARK